MVTAERRVVPVLSCSLPAGLSPRQNMTGLSLPGACRPGHPASGPPAPPASAGSQSHARAAGHRCGGHHRGGVCLSYWRRLTGRRPSPEPRGTVRCRCSAVQRRPANSSLTVIAARRSTSHPRQDAELSALSGSHRVPSMSWDVIAGTWAAYRRDISHSCRSPASAARCSGSIVPAVLSVPNTGLRQPQEQTAWTPPSPTSGWWCGVPWRSVLRGGRPGSSSSASRRRAPGPRRLRAWPARRCPAPVPER